MFKLLKLEFVLEKTHRRTCGMSSYFYRIKPVQEVGYLSATRV